MRRETWKPLNCSYRLHIFIYSRVEHGAQVGEVEHGQETKTQVQTRHPEVLQDQEIIYSVKNQYRLFTVHYFQE